MYTPAANRYWMMRIIPTMIAYFVLLIITRFAIEVIQPPIPRALVAILPAVPISFGVYFFIRYLKFGDELERKIQFDAISFSAGMTGVITFALGLLEGAGLAIPRGSLVIVFPMLIFFWGFGQISARKRYQ
jgi:hypothetical protein